MKQLKDLDIVEFEEFVNFCDNYVWEEKTKVKDVFEEYKKLEVQENE